MNRLFSVCFTAVFFVASTASAQSLESKEIAKAFSEITAETSTPISLAKFEWIREHADNLPRREYLKSLELAYKNAKTRS